MQYSYLTWPVARRKLRQMTVILPLGSMEQHGFHLPLATDALIAEKLANLLSKKIACLVLPTICYSISPEHSDFPGTIVISEEVLLQLLRQIRFSLGRYGLKQLVILNAHGGNHKALDKLGKEFRVINIWRLIPHMYFEHAGEIETSLAMTLIPSKVLKTEFARGALINPKIKNIKIYKYSKSGVMGDATLATKKKGKAILSELLKQLLRTLSRHSKK